MVQIITREDFFRGIMKVVEQGHPCTSATGDSCYVCGEDRCVVGWMVGDAMELPEADVETLVLDGHLSLSDVSVAEVVAAQFAHDNLHLTEAIARPLRGEVYEALADMVKALRGRR